MEEEDTLPQSDDDNFPLAPPTVLTKPSSSAGEARDKFEIKPSTEVTAKPTVKGSIRFDKDTKPGRVLSEHDKSLGKKTRSTTSARDVPPRGYTKSSISSLASRTSTGSRSVANVRMIGFTQQQIETLREIHKYILTTIAGRRSSTIKTRNEIIDSLALLDPEIPGELLKQLVTKPIIEDFETFVEALKQRQMPVIKTEIPIEEKRTSIHEINDLYRNWKIGLYLPFTMQLELKAEKAIWNITKLNSNKKVVEEYLKICKENKADITHSPYVQDPMLVPEYKELAERIKQGKEKSGHDLEKEQTRLAKERERRKRAISDARPMQHNTPTNHMVNFFNWHPPKAKIPDEPKYVLLSREETWKYHRELRKKVIDCKAKFYEDLKEYVVKYNKNFAPLKIDQMKGKRRQRFEALVEIYSPSNPKKYHPFVKHLHEDEGFGASKT